MQDLGAVVGQALFFVLGIRSQTQQVGVERHGDRTQRALVNLCCQTALLPQTGFVCLEAPEMTHVDHLQQTSTFYQRFMRKMKTPGKETLCSGNAISFHGLGDAKRVGRASVMLTTKSCLGGSFAGSSSLFSTPTGYTDWFWKSTFTLFR